MSETIKGFIIAFVVFILWSAGCFFAGYLLSNRRATNRIDEANRELAEQQQRYDELIRETEERIKLADERIRDIREQLSGKVSDNGQTITELSNIIEQIKRQRIDL